MYTLNRDWGVDAQIAEVQEINGSVEDTGVYVRIQLKASKNIRDLGDRIAYDLKNKARNKLIRRGSTTATRKILVLLCLDSRKENWVNQDLNNLILKKCAYWYYLEGMEEVDDNDSTTVLHIPKTNLFSPENIQRIMSCIRDGGDLNGLQNPPR